MPDSQPEVLPPESRPEEKKRPDMNAGAPIVPVIPRNVSELAQYADWVIRAGMVPAGIAVEAKAGVSADDAEKATKSRVMIVIEKGLEVGMGPITALSTIMIVNNRPTIWGDGAVALAQREGKVASVEQLYEGKEAIANANQITPLDFSDDFAAVFRIWRKGQDKAYEGRFSVRDAKRAHLWMNVKKEPWINYPKRMLMARARAFALREGFADCLMGLSIREEIEDLPAPAPARTDTSFLDDAPRPAIEHKPAVPFTAPAQAETEVVPDRPVQPSADTATAPATVSEPGPVPQEPAGPKNTAALADYVAAFCAWCKVASAVDLDLHQKRNAKWLGYIRENLPKLQEQIDLALDRRSLR